LTPIFSGFIRDDPQHLRHPRSINPYTDVKHALIHPHSPVPHFHVVNTEHENAGQENSECDLSSSGFNRSSNHRENRAPPPTIYGEHGASGRKNNQRVDTFD
jgi:hypothetical protein